MANSKEKFDVSDLDNYKPDVSYDPTKFFANYGLKLSGKPSGENLFAGAGNEDPGAGLAQALSARQGMPEGAVPDRQMPHNKFLDSSFSPLIDVVHADKFNGMPATVYPPKNDGQQVAEEVRQRAGSNNAPPSKEAGFAGMREGMANSPEPGFWQRGFDTNEARRNPNADHSMRDVPFDYVRALTHALNLDRKD